MKMRRKSLLQSISPEIAAFIALLIIASVGVLWLGSAGADSMVVATKKASSDTILITGLNLGEGIGDDLPSLSGTQISSFDTKHVHTKEGRTRYYQVLRLKGEGFGDSSFSGGQIVYKKDQEDNVGDFLMFSHDEPMFELEIVFSPGLESKVEDGKLVDMEDVELNILGKDFFIHQTDVNTDAGEVTLKLLGPTYLEFRDEYLDDRYSKNPKVNGKNINGKIKIRATYSGNVFRIYSIKYQFEADHKLGGDVFVPPRRGLRQYLREPAGLLTPSFNILYGGLGGAPEKRTITRRTSGNIVSFLPSGGREYKLSFTNIRGQFYKFPLVENIGGTLKMGDENRDLVLREGSDPTDYNIDEGDMFVVTSRDSISGTTNILKLDNVDHSSGQITVNDLSGSQRVITYDTGSNSGSMPIGGSTYTFTVDPNSEAIAVDQDRDGEIEGDRPKIVIMGGGKLSFGSAGSSLNIDFITEKRLFRDSPTSDEVIDFVITTDGSGVDLAVPSQSEIDLERDKDRIKRGMSNFGVLLALDDDRSPAKLEIDFPSGRGRKAVVYGSSGQANGFIVVTTELDKFVRKGEG